MLLIPCPQCGLRCETEFRCHGEVRPRREDAAKGSDRSWFEYVAVRSSLGGTVEELWCHEKGCGEWFRLPRDIQTHEIGLPFKTLRDE